MEGNSAGGIASIRSSQVEEQSCAVDNAVNRIHKAAHDLADRITRVTSEQAEKDDGCGPPQCSLVPLADTLRSYAERLHATAVFLENVTARVEL